MISTGRASESFGVAGAFGMTGGFGVAQTGAKKEPPAGAPKAPAAPTTAIVPPLPPAQTPLLGIADEPKPGRVGATGTQGPAPGIESPVKLDVAPRDATANLAARYDGSIQFATGARIDTKVIAVQQTAEPATPLKQRAEAMHGTHVDVRG